MCAREGLVVVEISKCFEKMYSGDEKAILEGLLSDGMLPRANAIIASARTMTDTKPVVDRIKELKQDTRCFFGYNHNIRPSVADFAVATLHILGEEEYLGDDKLINNLIECKLAFV